MYNQECPKDRTFYLSDGEFECSIQKQNRPEFSESELEAIQKIKSSLQEPNAYAENNNTYLQEIIQQSFQNDQLENVGFQSFRNARISTTCSTEGIPLDVISFILNRNPHGSCWIIRDAKVSDTCSREGIPFDDVSYNLESGNHLDGVATFSAVKSEFRQASHFNISKTDVHRDIKYTNHPDGVSTFSTVKSEFRQPSHFNMSKVDVRRDKKYTNNLDGVSYFSEVKSEIRQASHLCRPKVDVHRDIKYTSVDVSQAEIHPLTSTNVTDSLAGPPGISKCSSEKNHSSSKFLKKFIVFREPPKHSLILTAETPFHCKSCGMQFSTKGHLTDHLRNFKGKNPFVCGLCEIAFPHVCGLEVHRQSHSQFVPLNCDFCEKMFVTVKILLAHRKSHKFSW